MNRCINIGSQSVHNHVMAVNTNAPPPPSLFFLPSTHSLPHDLWPIFCLYYDHRNTFKECDGLYIFFLCKKKGKRSLNFHTFVRCGNRTCRAFSNNLCTNKTVNGTFSLRNQTSFVILYAQHGIRVSFL